MKLSNRYISFAAAAVLSGCGGGGGGSGDPSSQPQQSNQSPGGYWTTNYTVTSGPNTGDSIKAVAIVSETGQLYYAARNQNNGCAEVGFGQISVTGDTVSGSFDGAVVQWTTIPGVNTTCAYSDGSISATGTISGVVNTGSSLTLTTDATTSSGTALGSETFDWAFNSSMYNTTSSLATVAGNYTDGGDTLSISGSGVIFEQDPASGCVLNGQVSLIDSQYNVYSLSATVSNCMGAAAAANGVSVSGLATLDQTVSPVQLEFGISGSVNGQYIVYIGDDPKQ